MAEMITAIVGALIGAGGFIFGIIKWRDEKRERKNTEKRKSTQQVVVDTINNAIEPIKDELDELRIQVDENERDRLRAEIMVFVHELKNNQTIDAVDFEHIHGVYDKYHELGGNSYIEACMAYIETKEREIMNNRTDRE